MACKKTIRLNQNPLLTHYRVHPVSINKELFLARHGLP
jgi:hypothetical protein